jgi:hypothetical protein
MGIGNIELYAFAKSIAKFTGAQKSWLREFTP